MLLSCYIPAADSYTFPGGLNISTGDLIFWKYSVRPDRKLQGPNIFCCRIFSTITPHFIALISADSQDKSPGIRPIGIGETLRWLIGKMILQIAREDILSMVMSRQLCRTRSRLWEQCPGDEMCFWRHRHRGCTFCGCVKCLQLSQSAGSIEECSHPMPYLGTSTYQHMLRQCQDVHWGRTLPVTRGHQSDPFAMTMYAIGTLPLIQELQGDVPRSWYADNAPAGWPNWDSSVRGGTGLRWQSHTMDTTPTLLKHSLLSSLSMGAAEVFSVNLPN